MGEDPEYEYEWNNFSIVQVIDLDDEDIEESQVRAAKEEVQYSNLLDELKTAEQQKGPRAATGQSTRTRREKPKARLETVREESEPVEKANREQETIYYKCHLCFQQIPAKDYNEHYKEELKRMQLKEEEQRTSSQRAGEAKGEDIKNNLQSYLIERKAKKKQNDMIYKKKEKPDFLK